MLVTTGVTAALAWGLPDKPVYPDEELMQKYEDGHLPLLENRNDKNVTETKKKVAITSSNDHNVALMNWFKQLHNYAQYANKMYLSSAASSDSNYKNNNNIFNNGSAISNYYNYFRNRRPDSYYFGNYAANGSTKKVDDFYCNGGKCAYNPKISHTVADSDQSTYNKRPYSVQPPYLSKNYDPLTKYISKAYFEPLLESNLPYATTERSLKS